MKRLILSTYICCLIGVGLTGCSEVRDYSDTFNSETDFQYYLQEQSSGIQSGVSDTGYYFLNNKYIYYMDKTSMKPVLLDNRPDSDCLRKIGTNPIENCNAYVVNYGDASKGFLTYYNNKIYVIESRTVLINDKPTLRPELIELSLDGTKRKKIFTFDFYPNAIAIHRGIVYYSSQDFDVNSEGKYQIMAFDLNHKSAKPESIYLGDQENGTIIEITPYGKSVYFLEGGTNMYRTMRYDIQDKSITHLFADDDKGNPNISGIFNQKLIFSVFYGDPEDDRSLFPRDADLDGSNINNLPINRDFLTLFYASDKYIFGRTAWYYLTPELSKDKVDPYEMTVYNSKYESVDTFDLSFLPMDHTILVGDNHYMFVRYHKDDARILGYLDKQEIGTGHASFKTLIETKDEGPTIYRTE